MSAPHHPARNAFERVLLVGVALLLLFEEWGWEPLARMFARLRALPLWARAERWVQSLPPYGALVAFCLPALALFPVKLVALYFISNGQAMLGLALIVAAKIAGTAIVARLFQLTHPTLMQLPWFALWYGRWKRWKDSLIAWVRSSEGWRRFRVTRRIVRRRAIGMWRQWKAPGVSPPGAVSARLREAVRSDVPEIQRVRRAVVENRLVSTVVSDQDVIAAIEDTGKGWVVELDHRIIAFAIGTAVTGNIWALFVEPAHEREGHGRRLHDEMVEWLWSRGLKRLWLTTEPDTRAQRFYEAAGWQNCGLLPSGELRFERHAP